jgi:hypothetical protein
MGKKQTKAAAPKGAAVTAEQLENLTPEEQIALLKEQNAELAAVNSELTKEVTKDVPPSFEVDEDEDNDIEGGEYEFTAPTFTWDDGSVINVKELVEGSKSKDAKLAQKANEILAALVLRKSGLIRLKA